jgi:hypothetical protein
VPQNNVQKAEGHRAGFCRRLSVPQNSVQEAERHRTGFCRRLNVPQNNVQEAECASEPVSAGG